MSVTVRYLVPGALNIPDSAGPDSWGVNIEQMIWGHRLINDQSPWLLLLEAIAIMSWRAQDKNLESIFLPFDKQHEDFDYRVPRRASLRRLLFQDPSLDAIVAHGDALTEDAKWERWRGSQPVASIQYLRDRFESFSAFHDAVDLLRAAVVEPERERRSTSRHLVPGGRDMVMADYGSTGGKVNNDRKFFARGGELVFLMLNRSGYAGQIEPLIRARILGAGGRWNRVAQLLQSKSTSEEPVTYRVGYLPLPAHRVYERLGEDWLALLSLDRLPDDQLSEPLMRLTGLAIVRYLIERSAEMLGRKADQPIPVDMAPAAASGLRRVSRERFQLHREMSRLAISKVVDEFAASEAWREAGSSGDPISRRKSLIKDVFSHPVEGRTTEPDAMIEDLRDAAISKHENHLGLMLAVQAERIGLSVSRPGQGRWYAANNGLLEALVLANVTAPIELEQFLERLWARYRLVIGPRVGRRELGQDAPFEQLRSNQKVFEERLRMLGFLERLSDDCAFVQNPFTGGGTA
jgi:hypothetical protein